LWRWNSDAYGVGAPEEDVDGDGKATTIALRFPGQIYDAQTQLSYNYHRDYNPDTGRYVQSDPIGLGGGLNTYAYVEGNPIRYIDPKGQSIWIVPAAEAGATAGSFVCPGVGTVVGAALGVGLGAGLGWYLGDKYFNESADEGRADHAAGRAEDAKTNPDRQVGDKNKVMENGKTYEDADTGHTVHVDGDRVVITDSQGRPVTQFKNTRANTNSRVSSGKWIPR
ncbi:RHS repeat-associated core domain-containing protein, partial [Pseudomonas amygdali]|uniref:RHS repeat-associated core domain-containing protein n=1 Tax=Pseudomonas amygdali TaxID=47877 RepID=UPI001FB734EC